MVTTSIFSLTVTIHGDRAEEAYHWLNEQRKVFGTTSDADMYLDTLVAAIRLMCHLFDVVATVH
jgi:hypothetical protein